jgi:hypothetical protein
MYVDILIGYHGKLLSLKSDTIFLSFSNVIRKTQYEVKGGLKNKRGI